MAASMTEMVEAHLLNVRRELETLTQRVNEIQQEKARLEQYLSEGETVLVAATNEAEYQQRARVTTSSGDNPVTKPF